VCTKWERTARLERQKLSEEKKALELQQELFSKQQQLDKEVNIFIFIVVR
jgi:hypothetical protein